MRRWWHAERDWETSEAEVDLRVGGEVRVVMRDPAAGAEYGGGGRYTEVDPPRRLAFTWLWDDMATRMLIEIDFEERDGDDIFRTYFIESRGDEHMGSTWAYLDITALGRQEEWEDSPDGYPQTPPYQWWNYHDAYGTVTA